MSEVKNNVLYQKFYKTKAGKLVEAINNKKPTEDDEDLILFQVVDSNIGFNVFRYTKESINHVRWFEERDEAIEFAFLQSMGEQMKLQQEAGESPKIEPFKKIEG